MGREVKRVPLDFDWPLRMPWRGYVSPYSSQECKQCNHSGYSPEAKKLMDTFYRYPNGSRGWCQELTQDDVDALAEGRQLMELTHHWIKGEGWIKNNPYIAPTADRVNEIMRSTEGLFCIGSGISHYVIKHRFEKLGKEMLCSTCKGQGSIWFSDEIEKKADAWCDHEKYDPPIGDAYQVWETVSEGSPVTPPFSTPEEAADWLVANDTSVNKGASREQWIKFIRDEASSITMVMDERGLRSGVEA